MQFVEREEGEYRIFVGAVEATRGEGYNAAVVVNHLPAPDARPREVFRDDCLACGYRWRSADEAIAYALVRARDLVRKRSPMLTC
jgi:hypothetical protein